VLQGSNARSPEQYTKRKSDGELEKRSGRTSQGCFDRSDVGILVQYGKLPVEGDQYGVVALPRHSDGESFPGIVGYEYDRVYDGTQVVPTEHTAFPASSGLLRLGQSPVQIELNNQLVNSYSHTTLYTAPSGAIVFAAGTIS